MKPSSNAPPVAETRPPPIVPVSESIWAWLDVNLTTDFQIGDGPTLVSDAEQRNEPPATDAVPFSRGCS